MRQTSTTTSDLTASVRLHLKCDGTRTETRFRLTAKTTSPFKSAGASVQSITGSRSVRISGSNAEYTMFRGSVKSTGYPIHSTVFPSPSLPCVTMCQHIATRLYTVYRHVPFCQYFRTPAQILCTFTSSTTFPYLNII
jgi:hypothetical protein